jgi:Leucine-rich repeat (LRR) protein
MKRDKKNALIHRPGTGISTGTGRRTSPIIERMAQDVLARAKAQALKTARYRIGEYELREPDYRQILRWAEELEMAPEAVLAVLAESRVEPESWQDWEPIGFAVEDGAIVSLAWDFERLSLVPQVWEPGLVIRTLGFAGEWRDPAVALQPVVPRLQTLRCSPVGLESLNLAGVPELTMLYCDENQLTELDLSPVPELTELSCWDNELTELDLSPVPGLTKLRCGWIRLTELDLSPVPELTELDCRHNQLTKLDLSPVPGLRKLKCDDGVRIYNAPRRRWNPLRITRE